MKKIENFQTSTGETVTISRAEYEEFQAQRKKISELESRVDMLMEALRLARHILCLLLAAALLIQPISLRPWADEVTQQEETIAEESTEAEETEEMTEEPEETQEFVEESEPEETLPDRRNRKTGRNRRRTTKKSLKKSTGMAPSSRTTLWRSTAMCSTAPARSKTTGAASAAWL